MRTERVILIFGLLALAVVIAIGMTSCSEEFSDAERGKDDTGPADVMLFPDGFSNVAHKCDGPNMVYSSTNGSGVKQAESNRAAIAVVKDDPRCTGEVQ